MRDPILYPGAPLPETAPKSWERLNAHIWCTPGQHTVKPMRQVRAIRWGSGMYVCAAHACDET